MLKNLTISKKVFLAIFFFNLLGMIATIIFTTVHFKNTSEKYHEDRLVRKEQSVIESIDYLLSIENVSEHDVKKILDGQINELSDKENLDINIYNTSGELICSNLGINEHTISKTLQKSIINKVMHDKRVEIDSKVDGHLHKINSYNSIKNNAQKTVAIVNIPYVSTDSFLEDEFQGLLYGLIGIIGILLLGSSILAWFISNSITGKVKSLAQTLSKTDVVSSNKPLTYKPKDEIKPLVDSYNAMLKKLKQQTRQLALIEREEAWKEMAKQVAHEIKNPLTPMRLLIQNFEYTFDKNDEELEEKVHDLSKTLVQQIDIITSITDAFSDFAKMPNKLEEEINIVAVTQDSLEIFNKNWVEFISKEEEIIAVMDKIYFSRIITNLVKNALQSVPDNKEKQVTVKLSEKEENYVLKVSDNGRGIQKEIQDKIFEPKFTTKNSGMGLGLAMVKKIVEDYNGEIWFETSENGTQFYVRIPKFNVE